jgi:hypothetical protein
MATSGSTDWTLNRDGIINSALRKLRAVDPRLTTESTHITNGTAQLNAMVKSWAMDGIELFLEQEVVLFQQYNTQRYTLGPSGDNCALLTDSFKTQLAAAAASGAGTITVDDDDDIGDGDYIGIELEGGTIQWTTVNGSPAANVVTLTANTTGAAAVDNYVFTYTNKVSRPLKIIEARVRDTSGDDDPIIVHNFETEFIAQTDKDSTGRAREIVYTPLKTNGLLRVWPICGTADITDRLVMTIQRTIEDFDAQANNFDGPVDVLNCLIWNLALELAPEFGVNTSSGKGMIIEKMAVRYYSMMKKHYGNREPVYMRPMRR